MTEITVQGAVRIDLVHKLVLRPTPYIFSYTKLILGAGRKEFWGV